MLTYKLYTTKLSLCQKFIDGLKYYDLTLKDIEDNYRYAGGTTMSIIDTSGYVFGKSNAPIILRTVFVVKASRGMPI